MTDEAMVLALNDVTVSYHGMEAVRAVSFVVQPGEVAVVLGPNGSGKTTLFRAILGLESYTGSITLGSQPVSRSCGSIGYVPQRFHLDRTVPMTVREFLGLFLKQRQDHYLITAALEEVGGGSLEDKLLGTLSGGELQRVQIARAILYMPPILLMDEPTSGIDAAGTRGFYDLVEHINTQHNVTVLMISHEVNVAYAYADSIICLNRDLVCRGEPKTVLTKEVLKNLYGENISITPHDHQPNV